MLSRRDSVLDCGSLLPLWIGGRRSSKRQRTGAVQDLAWLLAVRGERGAFVQQPELHAQDAGPGDDPCPLAGTALTSLFRPRGPVVRYSPVVRGLAGSLSPVLRPRFLLSAFPHMS